MANRAYLRKANVERNLIKSITERQSSLTEHTMKRIGFKSVISAGKINGKRRKGIPKKKITDS